MSLETASKHVEEKGVCERASHFFFLFATFSGARTVEEVRVARWHIFKPKIPNLSKFRRVSLWRMLVYFMVIWYILRPFGKFCGLWIYVYIFWLSGTFSPFFPDLATLVEVGSQKKQNSLNESVSGRRDVM
jgi:hypothetical protein